MIHISIICVGKLKEKYLKDATEEYLKRLSRYCKIDVIELQDESLPSKLNESLIDDIKEKEGKKIIEFIKNSSYVLTLDLKGKQFTSEEFSEKIENISIQGYSEVTFIIGGTLGLSKEVIDNSNELISFSKMTFPHQLIRVFLLEQIFRAFKISRNETYHW